MIKQDLRIKICQESDKMKKIRNVLFSCSEEQSFKLRKELNKQDKKVDFLKKISNYL